MSVTQKLNEYIQRADLLMERFNSAQFQALQKDISENSGFVESGTSDELILSSIKGKIETLKALQKILHDSISDDYKGPAALPGRVQPFFQGHTREVELRKASQYDMPGDRPSACTFHAVAAMQAISLRFDEVFDLIANDQATRLEDFQRQILNQGLLLYQRAGAPLQGADFAQIKDYLPEDMPLFKDEDPEKLQTLDERLNIAMEHLFAPNEQPKTMWIKSGNEESFAVIVRDNVAIIFDSHRNKIIATDSYEAARAVLQEKLAIHSNPDDQGRDMSPFVYAYNNAAQVLKDSATLQVRAPRDPAAVIAARPAVLPPRTTQPYGRLPARQAPHLHSAAPAAHPPAVNIAPAQQPAVLARSPQAEPAVREAPAPAQQDRWNCSTLFNITMIGLVAVVGYYLHG